MTTSKSPTFRYVAINVFRLFLVAVIPLFLAVYIFHIRHWDLSVPLIYRNSDDIWQFVLTKVLRDTGWVLSNPYLGAPDIANWHFNAAAQTSALHSVLMLGLSFVIDDAVNIQQVYYLLNFSLICLTSFAACRLLGISRLPAFCVGLLFAFTTFRINEMLYAFLSNYFMVPLALVPVIWIMTGVFRHLLANTEASSAKSKKIKRLLLSKEFLLGLLFIVLMTLSDGYYAFFTLLLLGFATFVRVLSGDIKSPLSLLAPCIYIVSLIAISLALSGPLNSYKKTHLEEFFPNGIEDPSLVKHPFEAEVYSSTLKMMVAPTPYHRVERLGNFGKWIVETSDGARLFKNGRNLVPLGTLGSILFLVSMVYLAVPALRKGRSAKDSDGGKVAHNDLDNTFLSLIFFIFLCSILGGVGTLIALVFPTIRGYDRFPLFLIFVLYAAGAHFATSLLSKATTIRRRVYSGVLFFITIAALFDQIPRNADIGDPQKKSIFLAERNFVKTIEASLPKGAMVYQYPYSQYLQDSKYYGWGSFSHVRLYLHSVALRWSNGASKNSPVDDWHLRLSRMPIEQLLMEVQAVGFNAVVVDMRVVPSAEYQRVRKALIEHTGVVPTEDVESELAFFRLNDSGYRLVYDESYKDATKLVISDTSRLHMSTMPRLVNPTALKNLLEKNSDKNTWVIERTTHPEVFFTSAKLDRGIGEIPVAPLSDMQGKFQCSVTQSAATGVASDTVVMTIANNSDFDWKFNQGKFPLQIGVHLRNLDGTILRWDDGLRLSTGTPGYVAGKVIRSEPISIPRGTSGQLQFPLSQLNLKGLGKGHQDLIADFRMVQDGHAWFEHLGCKVVVRN